MADLLRRAARWVLDEPRDRAADLNDGRLRCVQVVSNGKGDVSVYVDGVRRG